MPDPGIKLLYILGYPHSGTTILGNLLGELDGFFHVGELRYLWERNLLMRRRRCGCGAPTDRCELWTAVLREAAAGEVGASMTHGGDDVMEDSMPAAPGLDPAEVTRWQRQVVRSHRLWRLLRERPGRPSAWRPLDAYVQATGRLCRGLARVTGARVVVDTSKWPADAAVLRLVPGISVSFVHLVRDPRGIVFSRQRKKASFRQDGRLKPRRLLLVYDTAGWTGLNLAAEMVRRRAHAPSMLVAYEEFVRRPTATIHAIAQLVGEDPQEFPFLDGRVATLGPNHTLGGNRNRFTSGTVELREDERWRRGLAVSDRMVTTALSLPLLYHYGYPVKASRR